MSALSFVPRWLVSHIEHHSEDPSPTALHAALLFIDVSGFSSLATALEHAHGTNGADELSRILNDCFEPVVLAITQHGGEVVRFAGDAVLAFWPVAPGSLALAAASLCAACGLDLTESISELPASASGRLQVRIGMGFGEVHAARVGGHDNRWQALILGAALEQVTRAVRAANAGELVVSPEALSQLPGARSEPLQHTTLSRLTQVVHNPRALRNARETPVARLDITPERESLFERLYVSSLVSERIHAGLHAWVSELRTITTLFIHLGSASGPAAQLDTLHRAVSVIQRALDRSLGSLKEVSVDDKGVIVLCAFGLPTRGGVYHPRNGLACALELRDALGSQGLSPGFGLSTGKTFCGPVGTHHRREYAVVGVTVNLAARLATLGLGVRCDTATRESSEASVRFSGSHTVSLKGFPEPSVYHLAESPSADEREHRVPQSAPRLTGRRGVLREIAEALAQAPGQTLVLQGEAGIGKSRVLAAVSAQARADGLSVVTAWGDPLGLASAYRAWRPAFEQLLGVQRYEGRSERTAKVLTELEKSARAELAPLLNSLLRLQLPDSGRTLGLKDFVRADATLKLLVDLLRERIGTGMLVVAEDWNGFDPASRALLSLVRQSLPRVHLLIALRPFESQPPAEHTQIISHGSARVIELQGLGEDHTAELVCRRLGVLHCPRDLTQWVFQRGRGNPFFSVELAAALKTSGVVCVHGGVGVPRSERRGARGLRGPRDPGGHRALSHRLALDRRAAHPQGRERTGPRLRARRAPRRAPLT